MTHDAGLIVTFAVSLAAALFFGLVTQKARLSPLVGYLMAGVVLGQHVPGFVADTHIAAQLAEIGVVLLMFGVGLHFDLKELLAVRSVAVPGAVLGIAVSTTLGAALTLGLGWPAGAALVFGAGISVASTVVLTRGLGDNDLLDSVQGRVAVGWLIVEDLVTVLVLVLLPAAAAGGQDGAMSALPLALAKILVLGYIVLTGGAVAIPWLLALIARTRSRELFTLAVLVMALTIAVGSAMFFGVSMALGAFLAGMVVGRSRVSHQAAADALPMRDAFAVLFFVSVGMLFDPRFLAANPKLVAGCLGIVLLAKPLAAFALVLLIGYSVRTALTVAAGLAQIGEFSFILADTGLQLGILPAEGRSALIAVSMFSIAVNPVLFRAIGPVERMLSRWPRVWAALNARTEARGERANRQTEEALAGTGAQVAAVVVGYGPVGKTVTRILGEFGLDPVVVDLNVDTVTQLTSRGQRAIYGDAAKAQILKAAGIERARYLLLTLPDLTGRMAIIIAARELNPRLRLFVRAHYLGERAMLEEVGADAVCYEEAESAVALAKLLLREVGADDERVRAEAGRIRAELELHGRPEP